VSRAEALGALPLMVAGVLAVYCPPGLLDGRTTLLGIDFVHIHERRIRYAQEHLFGAEPHLPAWYTRELLGTPFWSNIQSFPLIPVRLLVLALPSELVFAAGVAVAAVLAALFTFLYGRRIGLRPLPAAVAGWTFACAGYFASRVLGGHFPFLEAYPALPLLLWLVERTLDAPADGRRRGLGLLALGLASAAAMLAGHPQVPLYAVAGALAYALYRAPDLAGLRTAASMVAGIGVASVALWPMLLLVARSTRLLRLDAPINDIALPPWRIGALVLPWKDGWPQLVARQPARPFAGPDHYFWDTVSYVGWLPLVAAGFLLARALLRRRAAPPPWPFVAGLGLIAFLLALPPAKALLSLLPGTILRSPARLLYLTTFALALLVGALLDAVARAAPRGGWAALALAVAHVVDLGAHDAAFIVTMPRTPPALATSPQARAITTEVGDGRIAVDYEIGGPINRQIDDVGFFDSIMLARPYRALLDLAGESPTRNVQTFDGSALPAAALAYLGARAVVTDRARPDLVRLDQQGEVSVYRVPDAQPRAHFVPAAGAILADEAATRERLRRPGPELRRTILLPVALRSAPASAPGAPAAGGVAAMTYRRLSSDIIAIEGTAPGPGFVRLLETWDPGWRATLDGAPAAILLADGFMMAVAVTAGPHRIELRYATPGALAGAVLSLASLGGLVGLAFAWPASAALPRPAPAPARPVRKT
jgi:hypothetical protein